LPKSSFGNPDAVVKGANKKEPSSAEDQGKKGRRADRFRPAGLNNHDA